MLKSIVIYGDSISTINHGHGGYIRHLEKSFPNATLYNHAIGSSGLSLTTPNSLVSLLESSINIHPEADLIILWHGTNDWYWGAPLGNVLQSDPYTFQGALHHTLTKLSTLSPHANIIFLTPLYRNEMPHQCSKRGNAYRLKNLNGNTLRAYKEAIISAQHNHKFILLDLSNILGTTKIKAYPYFEDLVHPNLYGYKKISKSLIKQIKKLS
ncbi:MAG TPA: hypothetical protein DHV05_08260 [Acholeplasmataceae bacterium]|nr:hypothetical protein [Acholeplasmataceae bacterium]